jgi:hypothetical protein
MCKFGSSLFWVVTQRILVVAYRRFGTTYRSLFQGSWTAETLKMGLVGCPETSVNSYQHTLLNDPEERTPQLHGGGSLNEILWKFSSYLIEKYRAFVAKTN